MAAAVAVVVTAVVAAVVVAAVAVYVKSATLTAPFIKQNHIQESSQHLWHMGL